MQQDILAGGKGGAGKGREKSRNEQGTRHGKGNKEGRS